MTYNKQETTWNNLKWPTMSKTQTITTWIYYKRAKKKGETTNNKQILRLFTIWGNRFSFVTRFPPKISLQSFEHYFMVKMRTFIYNYVDLSWGIKFTGHIANHFDTRKLLWLICEAKVNLMNQVKIKFKSQILKWIKHSEL